MPGIVEDRIEDEVHRAQMPADDRSDLGCVAVGVPVPRVVAEFEIDAVEEC
jgi:hypothetical protein